MPILSTFVPIATTTVSGAGTKSITFSSISSTYTDLRILLIARQGDSGAGTSSSSSALIVNSDSGSTYGYLYAGSNPSGQYAGASDVTYAYYGETASDGNTVGVFSTTVIDIPNYKTTTGWKQVTTQNWSPNTARSGSSFGGYMFFNANVWRNTSAVTTVTIYASTSTTMDFEIGSQATLFGIKAA